MPTSTKTRTTIELNPGDKERLQDIALELGFIQKTTQHKGEGSLSALLQSLAQCNLDPATLTAIRAQAAAQNVSQSVVVDRAMVATRILNLIWDTNWTHIEDDVFEQLKQWKEQAQ